MAILYTWICQCITKRLAYFFESNPIDQNNNNSNNTNNETNNNPNTTLSEERASLVGRIADCLIDNLVHYDNKCSYLYFNLHQFFYFNHQHHKFIVIETCLFWALNLPAFSFILFQILSDKYNQINNDALHQTKKAWIQLALMKLQKSILHFFLYFLISY